MKVNWQRPIPHFPGDIKVVSRRKSNLYNQGERKHTYNRQLNSSLGFSEYIPQIGLQETVVPKK